LTAKFSTTGKATTKPASNAKTRNEFAVIATCNNENKTKKKQVFYRF
jgi:hypothetical protein